MFVIPFQGHIGTIFHFVALLGMYLAMRKDRGNNFVLRKENMAKRLFYASESCHSGGADQFVYFDMVAGIKITSFHGKQT